MFDNFKKIEWLTSEVNQHTGDFTKAIIAITLSNFLQIFTTLFVMVVYNKVIPNEAMTTLTSLFIGIAVILIFDLLFKIVKSNLAEDICSKIETNLGPKLYRKILSWDLQNVPKASGQSSTLTRDLDHVIELFTGSTITSFVNLPFIFVQFIVIYLIGNVIVLIPLVISIAILVTSLIAYFKTKVAAEPLRQTSIDKTSAFLETVNNLETLKSIGDYKFFEKKWDKISGETREISN